jgi:hypothetical protein
MLVSIAFSLDQTVRVVVVILRFEKTDRQRAYHRKGDNDDK